MVVRVVRVVMVVAGSWRKTASVVVSVDGHAWRVWVVGGGGSYANVAMNNITIYLMQTLLTLHIHVYTCMYNYYSGVVAIVVGFSV